MSATIDTLAERSQDRQNCKRGRFIQESVKSGRCPHPRKTGTPWTDRPVTLAQALTLCAWQDTTLGEILRHFHEHQKTTALLCHGPIATLAALPHAGEYRAALVEGNVAKASSLAKGWQYAGYRMTICVSQRSRQCPRSTSLEDARDKELTQ
jgi:hypothetical protein